MPDVHTDPAAAGREGGIKSGAARRRKAAMRADLRARAKFADESESVAKELLDAAMGRGSWVKRDGTPLLDPKDRVAILKTCLEYGVGRARTADPASPDEDDDAPKTGIKFGVADAHVTEGPAPD